MVATTTTGFELGMGTSDSSVSAAGRVSTLLMRSLARKIAIEL
jgi:hypothetical protein